MSRLAWRGLRILACMVSFTGVVGCGDACRDLAEQICFCLPDDGTRAACNQRASDAEQTYSIRPVDQQFCQQKIDSNICDCNLLQSTEGRENCGIAFGTP